MTRDEIRIDLRQKRKEFVIKRGNVFPFVDRALGIFMGHGCVGGYIATRWEADLAQWWTPLRESGHSIALPFLEDRDASMQFRSWDGEAPLEPAPFGFRQPSIHAPLADPDILFVPLTGFDRRGNRLGQGAGHYDRYFSHYPKSLKIGIGWSCQEYPLVPSEAWDVPLDIIITESEWIDCRQQGSS